MPSQSTLQALSQQGPPPPRLLTVSEFLDHFPGILGKNMAYELIRSGRIRSIRLGERKILIPESEITDWPTRELERQS